jgi:hypothetical protein
MPVNSAHFRLINDIDASATATWNGGQGFNPVGYFNGTIDGAGYSINGLFINRPGNGTLGFMTHLGPAGVIKNVSFMNVNITGGFRTGAVSGVSNGLFENVQVSGTIKGTGRVGCIVGEQYSNSTLTDCHVDATVSGTGDDIGGLVGYCNNGLIMNSSATGAVNGNSAVGGLVGLHTGTILNSNTSSVVNGNDYVGGLTGYVNGGNIENCHSSGTVTGEKNTGGLVGFIGWGSSAYVKTSFSTADVNVSGNQAGGLIGVAQGVLIENCFASGSVSGNNRVGGLVGELLWGANVVNCFSNGFVDGNAGQTGGLIGRLQGSNTNVTTSYWDTQTSDQNSSAAGIPQTTSQMLDPETFAAWDFNNIWSIDPEINNGYPFLTALGGFFMMVWTGNVNTEWENPGNWSTGNVPLPNETVRIPNVTNQPLISSFVVVNNMNIQPNADVTIGHNGSLNVSTTINNMAGANGLIIISNEDGTGSLIHNNNGVQATFQRYVPGLPEAWHMLSSPMTNQAITGSFTPPGDYADGTGYDFYTWYAPDTSWVYLLNDMFPPTWLTANGSNNFVAGRGYLVSYQQPNPTLTFSGTLNNGLINIGLTSNPGDTTLYGVNLIGNPYPSSIDWKAATGWDRSPLELSGGGYDIWIWNDEHENYGAYNSASAVDIGTLGVTRYIPPAQGFFVSATQTGNLVMDNTIRVHDGADNWLKTSAADTEKIFLAVTPDDGTNRDEVMIEFKTRDYTGGTRKKFSFIPTAPSLFIPHNGKNYSLRMLGNVENHPVIPVSFNAGRNGNYTISANFDMTSFDMLVLEDKLTGRKQDMLSDQNYAFYASTGDDPRRFVLHLKEGHYADPHEVMPVRIFTYASSIYLDMRLLDHGEMCRMEIVDLLGRRIYQQQLAGGNLESIYMPEMNGLFIVILSGNRGVISRKVYF